MILGHVTGEVWCTRKHDGLAGRKLLLVRPHFYDAPFPDLEHLVAVDSLDAGVGDEVVVCLGHPAREQLGDLNLPVDAAVMAVVDRCQLQAACLDPDARRPLRPLHPLPPERVELL